MWERFTECARAIVTLAGTEASRLGHDSIDTVHLLLGMIREGGGIAGATLAEYGIEASAIIRLHDTVRSEPDVTLAAVEEQSRFEALWLNHSYAGTEHLLLAVCCLSDSRGARLLKAQGKHPVQLCHFVLDVLGHLDDWDAGCLTIRSPWSRSS